MCAPQRSGPFSVWEKIIFSKQSVTCPFNKVFLWLEHIAIFFPPRLSVKRLQNAGEPVVLHTGSNTLYKRVRWSKVVFVCVKVHVMHIVIAKGFTFWMCLPGGSLWSLHAGFTPSLRCLCSLLCNIINGGCWSCGCKSLAALSFLGH